MIISPGRGYIFVHAPKTGGTALALALEERAMRDDIFVGDTPKAKLRRKRAKDLPTVRPLSKHSMLSELDGYLTPDELTNYFVFMLVRNPFDRMVSYYHWLRAQSFDHAAVRLAQDTEFAEFATHPQTVSSMRSSPYSAYVRDANGCVRCDLFVRLEHLDEDIAPLEAHLGFNLDIPHTNRSERNSDYRSYYSDETLALVAEMSAEDIQRFGYAFD